MIGYRLLTLGKEKVRQSVVESSERFQIEDAEEFGPDIEELSLAAASQFDIISVRSRERMNWRYADKRGGRYDIRIVRSEGKLVGYAVLKISGRGEPRSCEIVDMLVHPDYHSAVELLICDSARYAKTVEAISLSCRMLNNHPHVSALRRMGFVRLRSPSGAHWIKLTVRNYRKNANIESVLKKSDVRVHIMVGDTDGI
jgi:hypothetical protein